MKKINFDLTNNPFINFQSSRYSISARVNVKKAYEFSKQNDYSFFIVTLGCLMNAVNSIPQFKRRIINDEVIEFDSLDGVSPIMNEKQEIYREMRVKPIAEFESFNEWHDYVKLLEDEILSGNNPGFTVATEDRDTESIANFSCIPWIDFDSITTCVHNPKQIMPLITWGKFNNSYEMTVSVTISHIFVNGRELAYFYENAQKYLNNPENYN